MYPDFSGRRRIIDRDGGWDPLEMRVGCDTVPFAYMNGLVFSLDDFLTELLHY